MAQQPQQGGNDSSMGAVWVAALALVAVILIWKGGHDYIVSFIFQVNIWQAKLLNFFVHSSKLSNDIYLMQTINPASVDWEQLVTYSWSVGSYMRYPVILILVALAILLYRSNTILKYRKIYDMQRLRNQEQNNWPAIMPVVKLDLVNQDISVGPWAMALSPMEFARKNKLLKKNDSILDSKVPGLEMTAAVRRGDAKRVFTLQLGAYWEGFDRAPSHVRALSAVFMARIYRDRDAANNILKELNQSVSEGKPNYSIAFSTLKRYQNNTEVQEIIHNHAYLLTIMASLLLKARDDGVAPSSDFLWLKPVDRKLWYLLNCVGRQTPYAEVSGPFAHWKAEIALRRKSLVPMIDEAIKALEIAVKEVKLSYKELAELPS
jgi:intracellular multiplication protein IcmP